MKKLILIFAMLAAYAVADEAHHHHAPAPPAKQPLAGSSIYRLENQWRDQTGKLTELKSLKDKKIVISMIYLSCKSACPVLTADMKAISRKLSADQLKNVRFVLASIDPKRDTPDALHTFLEQHKLDSNWTLLTGDDRSVRELAAVLGIQYVREPNGELNHSNVISLLSEDGVVLTQVQGLGADASAIINGIK